jgi:hypothetical protein
MPEAASPIRIEYMPDGSDDAPLILIWSEHAYAARELLNAINRLKDGDCEVLRIDELPGFEAVENVELHATLTKRVSGLTRERPGKFRWELSHESWQTVVDMLAPFCESHVPGSYQWLHNGNISLVFSTMRGW